MNSTTEYPANQIATDADGFTGRYASTDRTHGETKKMLLYEDLSRAQQREDHQRAAEHRLANKLLAVRRWERLAGWAAKRAANLKDR